MAFFSEKDIFTLDLFLADATSGKIIKKLTRIIQNHEIDDFSFTESGGTWSPDSKKFAFVVFSKGINKLAIVDIDKGKITDQIKINKVPSFSNPAWSPDGRYIALTGLVNGIGDIYLYDLKTGNTSQLTHDFNSNVHPSWSSDGKYLVYSTENIHGSPGGKKYSFNIDIMELPTKRTRKLGIFEGFDNLNPCFSGDNQSVFFVSNADGYRNLYKYDLNSEKVYRLTRYMTGISGITEFSPAISLARENQIMVYNYYFGSAYHIYRAKTSDFIPVKTEKERVNKKAGLLPPANHYAINIIDTLLYNRAQKDLTLPNDSIHKIPYRPKFRLDYISNGAGVGISPGSYNTTSMAGSVIMMFSDIIGNNLIYSSISLNGEIYDFGGQVSYINQQNKIKWGVSLSHIPYRSGIMFFKKDTIKISDEKYAVNNMVLDYIRLFSDNVSIFSYFPLSKTRRLEAGATASWYYYRIDRYNNYFDDIGYKIGMSKEKRPAPKGNNYQSINLAYVEDNSFYGMTSPMEGHRSRFQVEKYFGVIDYYTLLMDYREYLFIKPFTLALRMYHFGRYGKRSNENITYPLYLGYPWFIRGYENLSFYSAQNKINNNIENSSFNISHLSGSKILLGNAEFRLPLSGSERLALIKSKWFLIDFNLFFDGGLAWNKNDKISFEWNPSSFEKRIPVFSGGASLRINVLGYLILEPYYAIPFQNGGFRNGVFGLNFFPGW